MNLDKALAAVAPLVLTAVDAARIREGRGVPGADPGGRSGPRRRPREAGVGPGGRGQPRRRSPRSTLRSARRPSAQQNPAAALEHYRRAQEADPSNVEAATRVQSIGTPTETPAGGRGRGGGAARVPGADHRPRGLGVGPRAAAQGRLDRVRREGRGGARAGRRRPSRAGARCAPRSRCPPRRRQPRHPSARSSRSRRSSSRRRSSRATASRTRRSSGSSRSCAGAPTCSRRASASSSCSPKRRTRASPARPRRWPRPTTRPGARPTPAGSWRGPGQNGAEPELSSPAGAAPPPAPGLEVEFEEFDIGHPAAPPAEVDRRGGPVPGRRHRVRRRRAGPAARDGEALDAGAADAGGHGVRVVRAARQPARGRDAAGGGERGAFGPGGAGRRRREPLLRRAEVLQPRRGAREGARRRGRRPRSLPRSRRRRARSRSRRSSASSRRASSSSSRPRTTRRTTTSASRTRRWASSTRRSASSSSRARTPGRAVECCSMLGHCFLEKGMPQLAIKWFRKGLEAPGIADARDRGHALRPRPGLPGHGRHGLGVPDVPGGLRARTPTTATSSSA